MARLTQNDPLEKFRFLVDIKIGAQATAFARAGFHDVQMPKRSTTKILYREGADKDISMLSPGLSTMEDIVLSRGALSEADGNPDDFYKWIARIHAPSPSNDSGVTSDKTSSALAVDASAGANDYRAEVTIKMLDRTGAVVRQWAVHNAWPMHYVPGSDMNAGEDGEKSIEALTLAYEDFQEISVPAGAPKLLA